MNIEFKLLKIILENNINANQFVTLYDEELFSQNQNLIKIILNYIKSYKCSPTLNVLLEHYPQQKEELEIFWNIINSQQPSVSEYGYYLDLLKIEYTKREIVAIGSKFQANSIDPNFQIKELQLGLDKIKQINSNKKAAYEQRTIQDYMPDFKKEFNEKRKNINFGRGIQTGYSFFDYTTGGLHKQELIVIAGSTGSGKSVLLNNLAIQMWMQKNTINTPEKEFKPGCNILYFSLEMPFSACMRRSLARIGDIPIYSIRDAKLNKEQFGRLTQADAFIAKYPYKFEVVDVARGASISVIEERFQAALDLYQPDVVVVDYLTLMDNGSDEESQDWLKLGSLAGSLHEFARVYNCVMLTAVQLNRHTKGKESGDAISVNRIGRSSLILHHANIGLMIEERKNEETYNDIKLHILKNRDGSKGNFPLTKKFANASILDIPFEPDEFPSDQAVDLDDISDLMAKYNWGKKS